MLTYKLLEKNDIKDLKKIFSEEKNQINFFKNIGWTEKEIINQLSTKDNYSLGLLSFSSLIGFIIGNLYIFDKLSEYEILFLYICKKYRKKGYATNLINSIIQIDCKKPLNHIILEVSETNIEAVKLYRKNKFNEIGKRKKYYYIKNKQRENALIFRKILP